MINRMFCSWLFLRCVFLRVCICVCIIFFFFSAFKRNFYIVRCVRLILKWYQPCNINQYFESEIKTVLYFLVQSIFFHLFFLPFPSSLLPSTPTSPISRLFTFFLFSLSSHSSVGESFFYCTVTIIFYHRYYSATGVVSVTVYYHYYYCYRYYC